MQDMPEMPEEEKPVTELIDEVTANQKKTRSKKPTAQEIRDDFFASTFSKGLLYREDVKLFYLYQPAGYYKALTQIKLEALLDRFLVTTYQKRLSVTSMTINEIISSLIRDPDNRLKTFSSHGNPETLTAFSDNTVYDHKTGTTLPPSTDLPVFHYLDFPFPKLPTQTPAFDSFISTTFVTKAGEEDRNLANFMMDALAYYISPFFPADPYALIFIGSGANGKSIFLNLIKSLVGDEYIAALSMEDLSDKFNLSGLINKRLNLVSEDQSRFIKADKIKALISNETVKVERKFEDPFFLNFQIKYIFSTNKDLKFEEIDYATLRRLYFVGFNRVFVDPRNPKPMDPKIDNKLVCHKDDALWSKLQDELPGIMYKILARARELKKNKMVIMPPDTLRQVTQDIQDASSSALEFFNERFEYCPSDETKHPTVEIYNQYETWYNESSRPEKFKLQARQFWSAISKNFPGTTCDETIYSTILKKNSQAKIHLRRKI